MIGCSSVSLNLWDDIGPPVPVTSDGPASVTDPLPVAGRGFYRFAVTLTAP